METSTRTIASAAHSTAKATRDSFRLLEVTSVETSHIIHDKLRFYIIASISLLWLSAQLRRYIARDLNSGCWYGWDALAIVAVTLLYEQKQHAMSCVFTAAYFVWTRLPGSPFNELHLPSFDVFLERTTSEHPARNNAGHDGSANDTDNIQEHAPECLVCWSSENRPLTLPCNHSMCRGCLSILKDRQQSCCPLCRRLLFRDNNGIRCAVHKAVVATFAARLTASGIFLLLQLWHGHYWEVAQSAATYIPQFYCFRVLHTVVQTQGVQWWQFGMFDYLMPLPVPHGRFWRSVWPSVIFTLLFSMGVIGNLHKIKELDLMVERVVHQEPFAQLYAS